jgi:hypothetical protein
MSLARFARAAQDHDCAHDAHRNIGDLTIEIMGLVPFGV